MARPGSRRRTNTGSSGKLSEDRVAWCRTVLGDFVVHDRGVFEPEHAPLEEDKIGDTIRLVYWSGGRKPFAINLTTLTLEELEAIEKLFKFAIDRARPICAERDRVAQEAFDNGDDSYARLYRQVPQFIVRERAVTEHGEGVQHGPAGVPSEPAEEGDGQDLRSGGDGVAEREPDGVGSQDGGPAPHDPAVVRPVGEVGDA